MRKSWIIWLVVSVFMVLYGWAGFVASRPEKVDIKLEPGHSVQVQVFRLAEDRLRMRLRFQGDHTRRPELGTWSTRSDWRETETLKFDNPGAAIHIAASVPGGAPVTYEAMPTSSWGWDRDGNKQVSRNLTASLSIAPGVWRWPPARNELVLHRGTNIVNIEVVSVDRPLVGETVRLSVLAPLGFKVTMPEVGWLWLSFLWPLLLVIQIVWAVVLGVRTWGILRGTRQNAALFPTSEPEPARGTTAREIISEWWSASSRHSRRPPTMRLVVCLLVLLGAATARAQDELASRGIEAFRETCLMPDPRLEKIYEWASAR